MKNVDSITSSSKNEPIDLRILLVEDDDISRKMLGLMLKKKGLECDKAINGSEALEMCAMKQYDIILMDCHMPIMNGYESSTMLRNSDGPNKDTIIIALTANAMAGDKKECIDAGMTDYVTKPVKFDVLWDMILHYA